MSRRRITAALGAAAVTLILATGGASGRAGTAPGQQAPVDKTPPSISGSAVVANTLSANTGTWQGKALKFAYQWLRCDSGGATCSAISGASGSAATLSTAYVGSTLRVIVTASNKNGSTAATSAQTAAVASATSSPPPPPPPPTTPAAVAPAASSLPVVSGTAQQNQTLTTSTGSWSGTTPMTYSYQWQRCASGGGSCAPISGATAASYVPAAADVGSALRASVTASNSAGSATASSNSTTTVTVPTSTGSACSGCYFDWEGDAIPGKWPGVDPAGRPDVVFPVDGGSATAIKIATGGTNCCASGTLASLYISSNGQSGQHTADGESTWYAVRVRFPSGKYNAAVGHWNMATEWHTDDTCGQLSSFFGVLGSGTSGQPATSAQLTFVLRGGTSSAPQEIEKPLGAPLLYDHWYNVVFHWIWKPSGGTLEWYVDGQLAYRNTNFSTLYTCGSHVDQPGFGLYNYRANQFSDSSEIDFDQTLIGPTAASIGFTP